MTGPEHIARYVMIGGFLGAGKTTAVEGLARILTDRGHTVGLITNDQSSGLVDTTILRSRGFAVEEISGGCFCCRFPSLQDAASRLDAESRPDVFLAEPVGSCTDLLATVSYPLRRIYGDRFRIAPLSVLVDPIRAARIFGLAAGRSFSEKVVYVYKKQLEEAEIIVVNKIDTLARDAHGGLEEELVRALSAAYPSADGRRGAARTGDGLEDWVEAILERDAETRDTMAVDYDVYAAGEAELGWLNATIDVAADTEFDANALLIRMTDTIRSAVVAADGEIAHLKMTLESPDAGGQLAVVSAVTNEGAADLRESLLDGVTSGSLIVNLRAEMAPEALSDLVAAALQGENDGGRGLTLTSEHEERFRPARPVPTHRDQIAGDATTLS